MQIKVIDAVRMDDGNLRVTIEYPRTVMQREDVIIAAKDTAARNNPKVADQSNEEYLTAAIAAIAGQCEEENSRALGARDGLEFLLGTHGK